MAVRKSNAVWQGGLQDGSGQMALGSGAWEGEFSFKTRFEEEPGTNPEELIAAAHAGCFSMQFSAMLDAAGHTPEKVETTAGVHLEKAGEGFAITRSALTTVATVPGIEDEEFQKIAAEAKEKCPVSNALGALEITLDAKLS